MNKSRLPVRYRNGVAWRLPSKTVLCYRLSAGKRGAKKKLNVWSCAQKRAGHSRAGLECQWNFFLVKEIHDSILEFRLHCKFTCRTLGEEDTCVATTSSISPPWTPTTNLGHEIGNVLQIQGFGQLANCGEKCGPMGRPASVFSRILLHWIISSTIFERCV